MGQTNGMQYYRRHWVEGQSILVMEAIKIPPHVASRLAWSGYSR
jgi:hypothetical protein